MIHIVWKGKGFLVFVFAFCFSLLANLLTNAATGSEAYWNTHKWPLAVSFLVSAAACMALGLTLQGRKGRILIDPKTHEEVVIRESHTLFFIPILWWGPILALFALIAVCMDFF
jgi:hypothetical protein